MKDELVKKFLSFYLKDFKNETTSCKVIFSNLIVTIRSFFI